jgi:AraC-like DNA-binding protein
MAHRVERADFATRDRDEAVQFIRRTYDGHQPRFAGVRTNTEFRVRSAAVGELAADQVWASMNFGATIEPVDQFVVSSLAGGRMRLVDAGAEVLAGAGDVFFYRPGVATDVDWRDVVAGVLRLPVAPVAELAEQHVGIAAADLRFEGATAVSTATANHWRGVSELVTRELHTQGSAVTNPLVAEQLLRTVATAVLVTFPNTTMTAGKVRGPGQVAPAAVRRAVAYLEANAAEPVRLAEVAAAAGLGVRALQYAFVRHYGLSPTRYLRRIRLDNAHRDLQAADPTRGDTVAAIAAAWGFATPSRFATLYRETYGRPPSHTLRT